MAIQFCRDCGNTLPLTAQKIVPCRCCGRENKNELIDVVTISTANHFPSKLRDKLVSKISLQPRGDSMKTSSTECPKCGAPDMKYAELQMRGADEGSTIFYSCAACRHRFTEDN